MIPQPEIIMILLNMQNKFILRKSGVRVVVFNVTFNNISVILWRPVLLVEKTRVPVENHRPIASH
jgi:hypothetical protein